VAESTLAVAFARPGERPRAERIAVADLSVDRVARPADPGDTATVTIAACGRPFPGHDLQIVDTDGVPCRPREVGEIVVRGPSVMRGYDHDAEATKATLKDGWLHTGDLGYLVDGELFVCGRLKDLIIANGRNYRPVDIEHQASEVRGLRRGRVVAFSVAADGGDGAERVVVCAEAKRAPEAQRAELATAVATRVREAFGLRVSDVVLLDR